MKETNDKRKIELLVRAQFNTIVNGMLFSLLTFLQYSIYAEAIPLLIPIEQHRIAREAAYEYYAGRANNIRCTMLSIYIRVNWIMLVRSCNTISDVDG